MTTHGEKLEAAVAYLRSRNKYITDENCDFVPTNRASTDVADTIRDYKIEMEGGSRMKLVGRGKK